MAGLQGHTCWADTATVFQTLHPHTIRFTYGFAQITLMHVVGFLSPGTPQIQVRCMFIWFFYLSLLVCFETTLPGSQYTDTVHIMNHFMQVYLSNDLYLHLSVLVSVAVFCTHGMSVSVYWRMQADNYFLCWYLKIECFYPSRCIFIRILYIMAYNLKVFWYPVSTYSSSVFLWITRIARVWSFTFKFIVLLPHSVSLAQSLYQIIQSDQVHGTES